MVVFPAEEVIEDSEHVLLKNVEMFKEQQLEILLTKSVSEPEKLTQNYLEQDFNG